MPTRPDKFSGTKTYVSGYFNSLAGFLKQTDGQHPAKSGQIDVVIECTLPKQQQSLAIFCQQILGNIAKLF